VRQLTAVELGKRRGLRRMKIVATGFLLAATVVYVVASWLQAGGASGWVGYVRTGAEAGMVGALADWFAVTALFRRPLGLPIPHTAIIPSRKDALGENLGDFVGTNFLSEQVVRDKLGRAQVTIRFGTWLADPAHAERVTSEMAAAVRGVVAVLRDEDIQAILEQAVVRRLVAQPWGPPLGKMLAQVLTDGAHHKLVDLMCDRAYEWVRDNHGAVLRVVEQRVPTWAPRFVDERPGRFGAHNILENLPAEGPWKDIVFLTYFNAGLRAVNVSDPLQPKEVGCYVPEQPEGTPGIQSNDIGCDDEGRLYLIDRWGQGMHILEYTG
jgi:uncharacterized membrane-anchored protein YjiN (DUF445 family)